MLSTALRDCLPKLDISNTVRSTLLSSTVSISIRGTRQHPLSYQKGFFRRNASISAATNPRLRQVDDYLYGASGLPIELEAAISSKGPQNGHEWMTFIDSYLPSRLRHGTENLPEGNLHSEPPLQINSLPLVLRKARQKSKLDLLSQIGVDQGRWEAVIWLIKATMETYASLEGSDDYTRQPLRFSWQSGEKSLDDITERPLHIQPPNRAIPFLNGSSHVTRLNKVTNNALQLDLLQDPSYPIEYVTNVQTDGNSKASRSLRNQSLGQIWQSLGTMILQAADHSPDDPAYSSTMTQVFRVLGYLHRISAFPDTIYNYNPAIDPTVLQRPPTLHVLSRRIMSTLSDVEFSLHWEDEIVKYQQLGYNLSKTGVPPRVREFGPELWLDLVLWACVEGGWITEGAWIVKEMGRREENENQRWSAISWQELCARKAPQLDWTSIIRLQIDRTRLNQVGGIGIATGMDSTVDMGTRTVSREVVLAIMDGLANVAADISHTRRSNEVRSGVVACKNLLESDHPDLNAKLLNSTLLRLIENIDPRAAPAAFQQVIDLRRMTAKNGKIADDSIPAQDAVGDDTAAILGLLHRLLYGSARRGDVKASLSALRRILDIVDSKRGERIQRFVNRSRETVGDMDSIVERKENSEASSLSAQIPVSVLVAFLDLIIDHKLYDLGKRLLKNDDVDGGAVGPEFYADRNLQPALLRFAAATGDDNFLNKVLEKAEPPLSEGILHALLDCQLALKNWSKVQEILHYFQKTKGISWNARDAMVIASTILRMERGKLDLDDNRAVLQLQTILSDLLRSRYNSPQDPSELPDLREAKLANQLGRIFKSLPDCLRNIVPETFQKTNRAHTSIPISPHAFDILLEAMVDCYGPFAGKQLWEQWCREPSETGHQSSPTITFADGHRRVPIIALEEDLSKERVVTPTIHMLRTVMRPILRQQQHTMSTKLERSQQKLNNSSTTLSGVGGNPSLVSEHINLDFEQDMLNWGINMYKKFGMSFESDALVKRHLHNEGDSLT